MIADHLMVIGNNSSLTVEKSLAFGGLGMGINVFGVVTFGGVGLTTGNFIMFGDLSMVNKLQD